MYNNGQLVSVEGSYNFEFRPQSGNKFSYIRRLNIDLNTNFEIWIEFYINFRLQYYQPYIKVFDVIYDSDIGIEHKNQIYRPLLTSIYYDTGNYRSGHLLKSFVVPSLDYWYPIYILYYYDTQNQIYKGIMSDYQLVYDFRTENHPIENKDIYYTLRGYNRNPLYAINTIPESTNPFNNLPRFLHNSPIDLNKYYCFNIPVMNISDTMYYLCNGDSIHQDIYRGPEITHIKYRKIINDTY